MIVARGPVAETRGSTIAPGCGCHDAGSWTPHDFLRARTAALMLSPYELTLELDASVSVCSPLLPPLLLREHAASTLDLAVNFEASPLLPGGSPTFGRLPAAVEDVLPHNFALLLRKGPALDAIFHSVCSNGSRTRPLCTPAMARTPPPLLLKPLDRRSARIRIGMMRCITDHT